MMRSCGWSEVLLVNTFLKREFKILLLNDLLFRVKSRLEGWVWLYRYCFIGIDWLYVLISGNFNLLSYWFLCSFEWWLFHRFIQSWANGIATWMSYVVLCWLRNHVSANKSYCGSLIHSLWELLALVMLLFWLSSFHEFGKWSCFVCWVEYLSVRKKIVNDLSIVHNRAVWLILKRRSSSVLLWFWGWSSNSLLWFGLNSLSRCHFLSVIIRKRSFLIFLLGLRYLFLWLGSWILNIFLRFIDFYFFLRWSWLSLLSLLFRFFHYWDFIRKFIYNLTRYFFWSLRGFVI